MQRHAGGLALLCALLLLTGPARAADPFLRRTATVDAVRKVGPAVVNITTERVVERSPFPSVFGLPGSDRFFSDLFERGTRRTVQSLGSGVLIDADRHILTNEHVIDRAARIRVQLADGREFEATLVGADPNNDLAVLRVETRESLPWVAPGSSSDLLVGEPVIAIGNPFGLSNTVTTGVLSARDRSLRTENRVFHGFLQTDASINPGNSGGPLLNAEGSLVGINTAIYGGAQGIGFAVPIDVARRIVDDLIEHGEVAPVWLGLDVQDLDARLHEMLEVPDRTNGALVSSVRRGGAAEAAGVRRGDIVTRVEKRPVHAAREFYELLEHVTVGDEVGLDLLREGAERNVKLKAAAVPESAVAELTEQLLGFQLVARGQGAFGVANVRRGSGAAQIGIQPGDLVLGINGRPLSNASALRNAVLDLRGRQQALLVVQRGPGRYHVTIPLG
ncbi:MAG: trypsin-like peptidase domain-containing protein [Deltaproteobacteria bacterium]|nr:trypsin-like peptidase domain-containing protein [Deltaproteobacteria bacterium]